MAGGPFDVTAKDIERLNNVEFLDLLNRLFLAEINKLHLPPTSLESTLRHTDPDQGVDSRTTIPASCTERWIPPGLTVWQFRSGGIKPAEIKEEFKKAGVQAVVKAGGFYAIVVGKGYGYKERQRRQEALRACFKAAKKKTDRWRLLTSIEVANWANEHLGLLSLSYLGKPFGDFLRVEDLRQQAPHQLQFVEDDLRAAAISAIRAAIERGYPVHLRVEGKAGAGKTRLVMESLNKPGLAERVLWALDPQKIPKGLFKWFETHETSSGIVVVDECPWNDAEKMAQLAELSGGRVVLITIDHSIQLAASAGPAEGRIEVGLMDQKKLEEVVKRAAPTLHPEARELIARVSGGYVKLATALALAYARDPKQISVTDLTKDYKVQKLLETLLPTPDDRGGMKALALSRIGWEEDLSGEGKAVAKFFDISWAKLQGIAKKMIDRGLVVRRGRYRYVTPHILAVWLASDVWETRGEEMFELLETLPTPGSKQALLERLLDLGDVPQARKVVEKMLGPEGLYKDLNKIDDGTRGKVFNLLATAVPEAGIAALNRLIGSLPRDTLLTFTEGRRYIVWTLQRLAWLPGTFYDAGRLLLRLADAENEKFSNNSIGVWAGLFRTYLGGTAVPAVERHVLIREELESEAISVRILGVKAIKSCFDTHEVRVGGAERKGGRVVPPEWRPKTQGEDIAVRMSALNLLDLALADSAPEVRAEALNTLLSSARDFVALNLFDEAIQRIQGLTLTDEERWRTIKVLKDVFRYDKERLTPDQLEKLRGLISWLEGSDLGSNLRSLVGPEGEYKVTDEDSEEREQLKGLVREVLAQADVLEEQLDWLTSPQARFSGVFGFELGRMDLEKRWLASLVERARHGEGSFLLSSYLRGIEARGETGWLQELLDEWTASEQGPASVVLETTWRSTPTKRGANRIITLVDKGWLDPTLLSHLGYGGWTAGLPLDDFRAIFERLLGSSHETMVDHAAFILLSRIEQHRDEVDSLSDLAWKFLDRAVPLPDNRYGSRMHDLEEITRFYAPRDPERLVRAILKRVWDHDEVFLGSDPLMRMLEHATRAAPERIWNIISAELLKRDMAAYRLKMALGNWYVHLIPEAVLLKWAADHQPHGPRVTAALAPVGSVPLNSLARNLLIQYGAADENVGSQLYGNFRTGSWTGPYSNILASKLATAKEWSKDHNKTVREWARCIVQDLGEKLDQVKLQEEEREW